MEVADQFTSIFRRVLREPNLNLHRELSSWDVPSWDSLANAQLLVEVQEEFDIEFTTAEALTFKNVGDLIDMVQKKLNAR
jgi:acyl carrier protein